jgi:hypothetical protein
MVWARQRQASQLRSALREFYLAALPPSMSDQRRCDRRTQAAPQPMPGATLPRAQITTALTAGGPSGSLSVPPQSRPRCGPRSCSPHHDPPGRTRIWEICSATRRIRWSTLVIPRRLGPQIVKCSDSSPYESELRLFGPAPLPFSLGLIVKHLGYPEVSLYLSSLDRELSL